MTESAVEIDVGLLDGFRFGCRPGCGLCCYAEPRVRIGERARLVQIVPEVEFIGQGPDRFVRSRGDGGACELLSENRCRAHTARPHPCREFPLTAHVGERLQATVVLSCPGVDLSALTRRYRGDETDRSPGFPEELAALRERVDASTRRRLEEASRRRRKIRRSLEAEGRWEDESEVRRTLEASVPRPSDEDFPVTDPPSAEDGLDRLPLYFDGRAAPVAIAAGLGGWELVELRPDGGVEELLGVVPPPDRLPRVEPDAFGLLDGYLGYWLRRDALFGAVHLAMARSRDGAPVSAWVESELRSIGALVLARADVRARQRRGTVDRLSADDLAEGIRATDQDLLDRESWGDRF